MSLSAEVGTTTEAELAQRLLTIETQASTTLAEGLRNLPAPAPAPPQALALSPAPTQHQALASPPPSAPTHIFNITNAPANPPDPYQGYDMASQQRDYIIAQNPALQRYLREHGETEVEMTDREDDDQPA